MRPLPLPARHGEDLLKPENKAKLQAILTYHVVPGKVMAADVAGVKKATSVEGSDIDVKVTLNRDKSVKGVMVDGADVVATDIMGANGVIHVIDSVILPG